MPMQRALTWLRGFAALAVTLAALAAIGGCGDDTAAADPYGSVSGFVTLAGTSDASGVTVTLDGQSQTTTANGIFRFTAVDPGTYTVSASMTGFESGEQSVTVVAGEVAEANFSLASTTGPANRAPRVLSVSVPAVVGVGAAVAVTATAQDPDGDTLSYAWDAASGWTVEAGAAGEATLTAPGAPDEAGWVEVTVTDGNGGSHALRADVVTAGNGAPIFSSLFATQNPLAPGASTSLVALVSDPDGDDVTLTWTAPAGWNLSDTTGEQVTITAPDAYGASATISVTASDTLGNSVDGQLALRTSANSAPIIASLSAAPPQLVPGGTSSLLVSASDPDGDTLTITWTAPTGWSVTPDADPVGATLTAPATYGTTGVVRVTVADGNGGTATASVGLSTVSNFGPVIASLSADPPSVAKGDAISVLVSASDPNGDALTYTWSIAPGSWSISGSGSSATVTSPNTPNSTGTVTVVVSDGSTTSTGQLVVSTLQNRPPQIASLPLLDAPHTGRLAWTYQVVAADPDGDTLQYTLSGAPSSASISNTGLLTWMPVRGEEGPYAFDVTVSDGTDSATQRLQGSVASYLMRTNPLQGGLFPNLYTDQVNIQWTGPWEGGVKIADINGQTDARMDTIKVDQYGNIAVALGNDAGFDDAFWFEVDRDKLQGCGGLQVGDLTGDGRTDIVASCYRWFDAGVWKYNPSYVLWRGLGGGSFTRHAYKGWPFHSTGYWISHTAIGDATGEGYPDLVQTSDQWITVWTGDGAGNFAGYASANANCNELMGPAPCATIDYWCGTSFRDATVADLDGDGTKNIVALYTGYHQWRCVGSTNYEWQEQWGLVTYDTTAPTLTVASTSAYEGQCPDLPAFSLADLDGDADLDLVAINQCRQDLLIGLNDGTGQLTVDTMVGGAKCTNGRNPIALADMDVDGNTDIVLQGGCSTTGQPAFQIHFGDGAGGVAESAVVPFDGVCSAEAFGVGVWDQDAAGQPDVALYNWGCNPQHSMVISY